jgi:hypothetical protein
MSPQLCMKVLFRQQYYDTRSCFSPTGCSQLTVRQHFQAPEPPAQQLLCWLRCCLKCQVFGCLLLAVDAAHTAAVPAAAAQTAAVLLWLLLSRHACDACN